MRLSKILPWFTTGCALAACSAQNPATADGVVDESAPPAAVTSCTTPNEGCPCDESGAEVDCGKTIDKFGTFVMCSMGKRRCDGARWGACIGENAITTKNLAGLGTSALGSSTSCAGIDDCDPYCSSYSDTPAGLSPPGFTVSDAGLAVTAGGDGGAAVPSTVLTSPSGVQGCGTTPIKQTTCIVGGVPDHSRCQQDHRCDVASNTCVWNGGAGYYDSTAGGPDLQIGAACSYGGVGVIPVCNRGSTTANPASGMIGVNLVNAVPADSCAAIGTATCTAPVPTGGLLPGQCMNVSGCGFTATTVAAVVNAGNRDLVEPGTRCKNNAATAKDPASAGCGACGSCDTRLTGRAYAPNETTPLAGISVFEPNGALTTFTDGVACDTCASLGSPTAAGATSDANGAFTIYSAVPGPNRIVTQSGRWRRSVTVNVPACTTTTLPAAQTRLPRTRAEGDIPKTAFIQGSREALECSLLKFGIASSEITPRVNAASAQRIQLWRSSNATGGGSAMTTPTGLAPVATGIWQSQTVMDEYSTIVMPCSIEMKDSGYLATADRNRYVSWLNRGGRAFLDHWPGEAFIHNIAAFGALSTWANPLPNGALNAPRGKVNTASAAQALMRNWLGNVGGSADWGPGWMRTDEPWRHALNPSGATTEWIRGLSTSTMTGSQWTTTPNGDFSLSYSYETPLTAQPAPACAVGSGGRVIYNGMHVAQARLPNSDYPSSSTQFPGACQLAAGLSSEEYALMYQFFQLTACALGGAPPPAVPPPPPPLPTGIVFARDFEAMCTPGTRPVWQLFQWQASVPASTSIAFRAATAASAADLPEAPPGAAPVTADIGTASATTSAWTSGTDTVDARLLAVTGERSARFLRVYMTFNTTASTSPSLQSWRQLYDCIPTE